MPTFSEDQKDALDLLVRMMESNTKFSADLTNSLMESYERSAVKAETELRLVRHQMNDLYASDYQPSERKIFEALYPNPDEVDRITEVIMEKRLQQRGW